MPLDVVRTRLFAGGGMASAAEACVAVWREGGVLGFFRGWTAAYVRLGPILVFFPAVLEQTRRRLFGLEYMA